MRAYLFQRLLRNESARTAMSRFLQLGGQTRGRGAARQRTLRGHQSVMSL